MLAAPLLSARADRLETLRCLKNCSVMLTKQLGDFDCAASDGEAFVCMKFD